MTEEHPKLQASEFKKGKLPPVCQRWSHEKRKPRCGHSEYLEWEKGSGIPHDVVCMKGKDYARACSWNYFVKKNNNGWLKPMPIEESK